MKLRLFCCFIAITGANLSYCQEPDSILVVKNNDFFKDLVKKTKYIPPIYIVPNGLVTPNYVKFKSRGQLLIKTPNHLYLTFSGGGWLYQLTNITPTDLVFKRNDKSENFNYNFDAFYFSYKENIYNLGGYGFWKSNGTLRKFNFTDKVWDVDPLNMEIHTPSSFSHIWFSNIESSIYIPFHQLINTGIILKPSESTLVNDCYKLNLTNNSWERLGATSSEVIGLINGTNLTTATDQGLLTNSESSIYLIDFENNQVKMQRNGSLVQSLQRLDPRFLKYYYHNKIYFSNIENGVYDSLNIPLNTLTLTNYKVWKKSYTSLLVSIASLLLIIILFYAWRILRKRKKAIPQNLVHFSTHAITELSETEHNLIEMLILNSKQNKSASVTEINYILGTKNKNAGLQKKVRSDIISSINQKYRHLTLAEEPLIQSIRNESDKRYFEYFIKHEMCAEAEKLISHT